jgi:6-phosphogluconate dehydrogenase
MTAHATCDVAVVGLGVMGSNLARNLARNGARVAGYGRDLATVRRTAAAHPEAQLTVTSSWSELVALLARPRRILLLVPAGAPVDAALDALDPLLEAGDVVVDAGNSHTADTDRRLARAAARPWSFVGMGVSGGAEGALNGPSLMPGGDVEAWRSLRPLLESIAARSEHGLCVAHCGSGSAGHFVKMVHNGIEYGDMQLIAETALLLRRGLALTSEQAAGTFAEWNEGELDSFLVEIAADVLAATDPLDAHGGPLVDAILDRAGQKGTGTWTVAAALELGVAVPTITAAVDARVLSAGKALRVAAEARLAPARAQLLGVTPFDLEAALWAAKLASYTQGFALLAAGSRARGYGTDAAEIARIWTGGCIIRARLLGRVLEALRREPPPELLVFAFAEELGARLPSWRRVVAAAAQAGLPVPGLAASLAWFDTLTTARGSASLIQAQRDLFGAHGYERIDRPGVSVHTDWIRRAERRG